MLQFFDFTLAAAGTTTLTATAGKRVRVLSVVASETSGTAGTLAFSSSTTVDTAVPTLAIQAKSWVVLPVSPLTPAGFLPWGETVSGEGLKLTAATGAFTGRVYYDLRL